MNETETHLARVERVAPAVKWLSAFSVAVTIGVVFNEYTEALWTVDGAVPDHHWIYTVQIGPEIIPALVVVGAIAIAGDIYEIADLNLAGKRILESGFFTGVALNGIVFIQAYRANGLSNVTIDAAVLAGELFVYSTLCSAAVVIVCLAFTVKSPEGE
jgi:hypothetical protein